MTSVSKPFPHENNSILPIKKTLTFVQNCFFAKPVNKISLDSSECIHLLLYSNVLVITANPNRTIMLVFRRQAKETFR